VAGAILRTLSEPFPLNSHSVAIGVSIGIAMFPNDGRNADTLTKNADIAMYRAKELGRNNYQFHKPSLNAAVSQRLMLESSLGKALENEEFILQYQPIVEIGTGNVTGAEALIRWRKQSGEIVSPAALIPIAEETGLIVKIGEWTVRAACRQMREWADAGTNPPSVAINLSAMQLHRPGLSGCVQASLRKHRVPPSLIELEITETTAMLDDSAASKVLHEISSMGVRIAIDDFGTGYSSLSRLSEFPVNRLKIDRSFICGIPGDGKSMAIARSVIDLGRNLGIKVTAEGVETGEQLAFLRYHGCDEAQGYLFSRPLDPDAFARLPGNFKLPDAGRLITAAIAASASGACGEPAVLCQEARRRR
jgi:EAL domain-containing protein (putative c-di-GMP-specific phosphodiesterase class I)